MTIYSWGAGSPIEKVETGPGKAKDAVIFAAEGSARGELAAVPDMLRSLGMTVVPDIVDDKFALRVSGFAADEEVAAALEKNGFVPPAARNEQASEKPKKERVNPIAMLREKSLVASGWVYFLGDAILASSGLIRKDYNEVAQAAAFTSSSLVLMRYGEPKADRAFGDLYNKMLLQFNKEGVEVPDLKHTTVKDLTKPGGLVAKVEDFLYRHPAEVNNAINAYAGFEGMRAGMNQKNHMKVTAGALILIGMATAVLVPEKSKKKAPQTLDEMGNALPEGAPPQAVWQKPEVKEDKGPLGVLLSPAKKFADWVQEKPLRFGGYAAIANNAFSAVGAWNERTTNPALQEYLPHVKAGTQDSVPELQALLKKKMTGKDFGDLHKLDMSNPEHAEKFDTMHDRVKNAGRFGGAWRLNMAVAATYAVGNGLLAISSKGDGSGHAHGGGDSGKRDVTDEIISASASILAAQPDAERGELVDKMSAFLAEQRGIPMEPKEIAAKLNEKIEKAKDSPWLEKTGATSRAAVNHAEAVAQQREQADPSHALGA